MKISIRYRPVNLRNSRKSCTFVESKKIKMMDPETLKTRSEKPLEDRLSALHDQLSGVTSRLDRTERELDLERALREDIIKAEVELTAYVLPG